MISYFRRVILFPPCKINLGLNVIRKREDGFHEIESVFYPVPFRDILEIIKSDSFSFSTTGLEIPGDTKGNLVIKAFELMKKRYALGDVKIHLHKRIPMGAGLGGGSSDGAFALKILNEIFDLRLDSFSLKKIALELGSDCPFFIEERPAFATGRGEILKSLGTDLSGMKIILVNPGIHVSTSWAYSVVNKSEKSASFEDVIKLPVKNWKGRLFNSFEEPVFNEYPEIRKIKEDFYEAGAVFSMMSGSGSTVFGIFTEPAVIKFPENYRVISVELPVRK